MEIEVPPDRSGSFEPLLIAKGQKRFEGFDEKIIAMYARGMTVREIAGFLLDQYKVVPSHALRGNGDHVKNGSGERVSVTSVTRNSNMITRFLATNPPSLLASAVRQAASVSIVGADFKKLKATFEEKRYLEAKDLLDELV